MGERVSPSRPADVARATQLKKALESGAPPAFLPAPVPGKSAFSEASCSIPPWLAPFSNRHENAETRLQFLEQMFQAYPDALSNLGLCYYILKDLDNAQRYFVRTIEYEKRPEKRSVP